MSKITPASSALNIGELINEVLQGKFKIDPQTLIVVGAFWVRQSTQFPGAQQKYRNYYLLLRVGKAFGGCCIEQNQVDSEVAEQLSGKTVGELLEDPRLPVRIAALDAYLATAFPHHESDATLLRLPYGTPVERAVARDNAIVGLLDIEEGQKVGLIGVVNPIVDAIHRRKAHCLPCDFNMDRTAQGLEVLKDMQPVLAEADLIIATGMTLSNGSFDEIVKATRQRDIPLLIYAQTGSAVFPQFLGRGVTAISAEPFPYSQFSAEPTSLYLYQA